MRWLSRCAACLILCLPYHGCFSVAVAQSPEGDETGTSPPPELLTVAERTDFEATATYEEVIQLSRRIADSSPLVEWTSFGSTFQGKSLPLLIISEPPVATADAVAASPKVVVLVMGNIHAGEVCGKEAILMLARELTEASAAPLLKNVIVLLAPLYNADGNDLMSVDNRPGQDGPLRGMGQRENAQGFDLNRDHVKLESPEVRSFVRLLNDYDPDVVVDTHTTNGSRHAYTITYDAPRHPAVPGKLVAYLRNRMLPAVGARLEQETRYRSFFYGNFSSDRQRWETYPAWPRYNTQYVGLRGRFGILSEAYAYATFRDRVLATRGFLKAIVTYVANRHEQVRAALTDAERKLARRVKSGTSQEVAIASRMIPCDQPARIATWEDHVPQENTEESEAGGSSAEPARPTEIVLSFLGRAEATRSVDKPWAYLIPPTLQHVTDNLHRHGIQLSLLREDITVDVESYRLSNWKTATRAFQGHYQCTTDAKPFLHSARIPAGTIVARTDQLLSHLLVNLLEPQAEDGLLKWNFFDAYAPAGETESTYPIHRLREHQPLLTAKYDPQPAGKTRRPITFETLFGKEPAKFNGQPAGSVTWLSDGEHFLQQREREYWKIEARTGTATRLFDTTRLRKALAVVAHLTDEQAGDAVRPNRLALNRDASLAITAVNDDYYLLRANDATARRLTFDPQGEELVSFSPDSSHIVFVRDFDLHAVTLESGRELRLTTDGTKLRRHGKADWVYFEEIYGRSWKAYHISPDSRAVAFLEFDDHPVSSFTVLQHMTPKGGVEQERYPKAGDPIPRARVGIVPIRGGPPRWVDLSDYSEDNRIVTRIGWLPDSQQLFVMVQNRAQTWLDFCLADAHSGSLSRLFRARTQAFVDDPGEPRYLDDQSFLLCHEANGWRHIYHYEADGTLRRQVTDGAWEVRRIEFVDKAASWIYFRGTVDSPIAEQYYRVPLSGGDIQRLTDEDGTHRLSVAPQGGLFVDTWSSFTQVPQVRLRDADGTLVRTMDINPVPDLDRYVFGRLESLEIPLDGGFRMPCTLVYPPDFDPSRQYPVWLMTYGGPHAPTVGNQWSGGRGWEQLIAAQGILVFRCDPRTASGQGAISTWQAYEQLGVQETRDIEAAVEWLAAKPFVDASRFGMSGYSYGGYLTAYVMTHSDKFAAGIAGAPVTDWRNYDAFYTERFMNTPQENQTGYEKSSVVEAAEHLHGRLLVVHGSMDDNVHVQNTLELAGALQEHDIAFEMMIYPTSRHGIRGDHFRRLSLEFIRRTMRPGPQISQ